MLAGAGGGDTLRGGNNEDTLLGEDGDDTLDGGNDADVFVGAAGTDTATFANRKANQPVTVTINAIADDGGALDDIDGAGPLTTRDHVQTTVEDVRGGRGADSLTGSGSANELIGGPGADGLFGLGGDDLLRANDGVADAAINCGVGAADESIEDAIDPAPVGLRAVAAAQAACSTRRSERSSTPAIRAACVRTSCTAATVRPAGLGDGRSAAWPSAAATASVS